MCRCWWSRQNDKQSSRDEWGWEGGSVERSSAPPPRLANYVGGDWRQVEGAELVIDADPFSGEAAALVPLSGASEVGEAVAVAVAVAAAAQPGWRQVSPQRRARALLGLREELIQRRGS
jgi:acyl-CoA reductase-like NAD-dependent aldehyde dehydrogenase